MPTSEPTPINGLRVRLVFFDYIYMLGEFLSALSELHVKIQLVERYCNKVQHNLRLLENQGAKEDAIRSFIQTENRELVNGLERQNIFYDKYRLRMIRVFHEETQGELLVEDGYGGSQYVVPTKLIVDELLKHVFDSTLIQDMGLFPKEREVMTLPSSWDERPGDTAHRTILELNEAARHVHTYVKKEKVGGIAYLAGGKPVTHAAQIAAAEQAESDKDRFLKDPLVRKLFAGRAAAAQQTSRRP